MKIVHVITDLETGGAEMMLYKLLSRMNHSAFESEVISLAEIGPIGEKIQTMGVPVRALGMRHGVPNPMGMWQLVRFLRHAEPDAIQAWMYHANLMVQLAAFFLSKGAPVLWNIRGSHTDLGCEKFLSAIIIWLGARLSLFPVKIVNNSRTSALSHEQNLGFKAEKWVIIPNGFDVELFLPSVDAQKRFRAELGLTEDIFLIGLIGRLHPMKDHANFLRAASILLRTYPKVRFVLVGTGVTSADPELTEIINSLHLGGSLHLLGEQDGVHYITAAFDIACSCSSYGEGFPNVVGEAMSCGVPCVVTDVGDSAWIVGHTGRVVPPRDPIALANAWRELIEMGRDARHELGLRARKRVAENFSLNSVVQQYENLYKEIYLERP